MSWVSFKEMNAKSIKKVGNSWVVYLTDELKKLGMEPGDKVVVDIVDDMIQIKKSRTVKLPEGVSPDFYDTFYDMMIHHSQALEKLKDK